MYIVPTEKFRAFAEAVLRLGSAGFASETDPDQVKVLMGETLDLWPASIFVPENDNGADGEPWLAYSAST